MQGNIVSCVIFLSEEMKKYQRDSENAFRRGVEPLKDKIKDDKLKRDKLEKDIRSLEDALRDLVAKNNVLQGKVSTYTCTYGGIRSLLTVLIKASKCVFFS